MGEMNEQVHRLLMEQRKTLTLGGVQDVKSFDENEVLLLSLIHILNAALEEVMKDPAKNTKEYLTEYVKTLL